MNIFITYVIVLLIGYFGGRFVWARYKAKKLAEAYEEWKDKQKYTIISILAPRNNEKTPLAAEQFFSALHGIFRDRALFQYQVSLELAAFEKFIHFYIHVPTHLKEFVEGQIYAQYPDAEVNETEDYTNFVDENHTVVGAELETTKPDVYPIKTFVSFQVDPLASITGVLGNLQEDENLWLQCIIRPVSDEWQARGVKFVADKRAGKKEPGSLAERILQAIGGLMLSVLQAFFAPPKKEGNEGGGESDQQKDDKPKIKLSAPEEAAMSAIEEKITKLGFETKIRLIASSADAFVAQNKLETLIGAFKQFNSTNLNGFKAGKLGSREVLEDYRARRFDDKGYVLNTEELASFYHLPSITVETPNIVWSGSKKAEPPADLPIEGKVDPNEVTFFGETDFRSFRYKFGIKHLDRRLHMYSIGKTGTGKSTLLKNMIIDDINKGKGLAIIDPHGQTVEDILGLIPDYRVNDVIYFNPADREFPIGFNPIESIEPDLKNVVASGVVGIFKKLWAESWGPRLEYILRNAILALVESPDATLLGINRILTERPYRKKILEHVTDPVVKEYFRTEFENYSSKFRQEAIAPIQNKVGQFLSSTTIRNIIGQPKSAFNMRKAMDEGKILLFNLSIGRIGEDTSTLLGALLITQIQISAMMRADVPEDQRQDFYLYVDEFQNFATESFAVILSEARKYHLNLILTNQYIAQMPEVVRDAIFGNVGTLLSFRVGADDAQKLSVEFDPVFTANDLVNLDNYNIYVKMSINGVTRPAFSAKTLPPIYGDEGNANRIIKISRERFGSSRQEVEAYISKWAAMIREEQAQPRQGRQDNRNQQGHEDRYKSLHSRQQDDLRNPPRFTKERREHSNQFEKRSQKSQGGSSGSSGSKQGRTWFVKKDGQQLVRLEPRQRREGKVRSSKLDDQEKKSNRHPSWES